MLKLKQKIAGFLKILFILSFTLAATKVGANSESENQSDELCKSLKIGLEEATTSGARNGLEKIKSVYADSKLTMGQFVNIAPEKRREMTQGAVAQEAFREAVALPSLSNEQVDILNKVASGSSIKDVMDEFCASKQASLDANLNLLKSYAEQGNADAQTRLGLIYKNGDEGVQQDYSEAIKWLRLGADQGDVMAQSFLGMMYDEGQGVTQDFVEATKWFRLAAKQGEPGMQTILGYRYVIGKGVEQNIVRAHMWFNVASTLGIENAKNKRDEIAQLMTTKQIAKAQKMAKDCQTHKFKNCD